MSAYRVEPAVLDVLRHHYRVFHGADVCVGVARTRAAAERIARALAVLDAMEQEQATRVDPLTGLPPDGPKCRRHGVYKLAVAHYYCEECAKEGRATVGPASVAAEA